MGLYVAIVVLATLAAIDDASHDQAELLGLVWGVTIGTAVAHWFAFTASAFVVGSSRWEIPPGRLAGVQIAAAVAVGAVCTLGLFLFSAESEADAVRVALATSIAGLVFVQARWAGRSIVRSVLLAVVTLSVGVVVAAVKWALHH